MTEPVINRALPVVLAQYSNDDHDYGRLTASIFSTEELNAGYRECVVLSVSSQSGGESIGLDVDGLLTVATALLDARASIIEANEKVGA